MRIPFGFAVRRPSNDARRLSGHAAVAVQWRRERVSSTPGTCSSHALQPQISSKPAPVSDDIALFSLVRVAQISVPVCYNIILIMTPPIHWSFDFFHGSPATFVTAPCAIRKGTHEADLLDVAPLRHMASL